MGQLVGFMEYEANEENEAIISSGEKINKKIYKK